MSTGHRHAHSDVHIAQYDWLCQQPWFQLALRRPYQVVTTDDLPWVGGSSVGLEQIYVNARSYPAIARAGLLFGLIKHERIEGILLEHRWRYLEEPSAHLVAAVGEERENEAHGWTPDDADKFYEPIIAAAEGQPLVWMAGDLHMEPYVEEADAKLLGRMRLCMAKRQYKVPKEMVHYGKSTGADRCGICAHYERGACQTVEGPIEADDWCTRFVP